MIDGTWSFPPQLCPIERLHAGPHNFAYGTSGDSNSWCTRIFARGGGASTAYSNRSRNRSREALRGIITQGDLISRAACWLGSAPWVFPQRERERRSAPARLSNATDYDQTPVTIRDDDSSWTIKTMNKGKLGACLS